VKFFSGEKVQSAVSVRYSAILVRAAVSYTCAAVFCARAANRWQQLILFIFIL
jgi:hypothetical protein